ncbi:multidrug ABC transporter ATP-binding protein [Leptolyngbya valderiana BDU 20041]|nr:ABC-F family ATP-binding cassette domain-containing protein [Geitlerinema sp. CS-897]OAB55546.1 multidrug ABC transporter ATP-binding protein [Leptolyngbya valderiana BDU 20041]
MSIVTLQSIEKDFGIKEILRNATFSIDAGEKVGSIGTNGSGKSTLLKIIAGKEPFDAGERLVNRNHRIIYLPQQPELDENRTVLEQVFADCGEKMSLVRQYEELSHRVAQVSGAELDRTLSQLTRVTEQMDAVGTWDLETEAKIILSKLGIEDFDTKIGTLSGGYRKRIALAAALLAEPDLLLMDEPTNHLDAEAVEWLQNYLQQYKGAVVLVTHDRYFLDKVTTRILEVDRGDLYEYSGNYSYYLEKKAQAEEIEAGREQKHYNLLRRELEWIRRGPKARSTKQKARIQRFEGIQNTEFKQSLGKVDISTASRRIGKKVIELDNIGKSYKNRTLFEGFSYSFDRSDRVGIIGGNGAGKSTLLNIITGRVEPDTGTVEIGETIHFGYFDQHSDSLIESANQNQRVIDYIKEVASFVKTADGSEISASQMLERFLFPPSQQYAPLHKLSGGEKRRLFLLRVLMGAPNVLILDEPTNDLDVQTLAVLEDYLDEFNGCVIVVSHDRYFLDRTVDKIFALDRSAIVKQYPGNYSVYLEYKQREDELAKQAEAEQVAAQVKTTPKPKNPPKKDKPRRLSYKEKRELERLDGEIPQLEAQKTELEAMLYENPPSEHQELEKLSLQLAELTQTIDDATMRWLELAELES